MFVSAKHSWPTSRPSSPNKALQPRRDYASVCSVPSWRKPDECKDGRAQALVKLLSRGDRTIRSVAEDLNVNHHTLKNWMKKISVEKQSVPSGREKRPQDCRPEEQLIALHETHALSGDALQAWCRERGLFAHHLASWTAAFCVDGKGVASGAREIRTLKDQNEQLWWQPLV